VTGRLDQIRYLKQDCKDFFLDTKEYWEEKKSKQKCQTTREGLSQGGGMGPNH
jgi:hypothetical protein